VNEETSYKDAYVRSQNNIRKMIPLARELNIIIAVENVWNRFLLSPLEFKRYVEEFDSPFVKAYFDVGNIVIYGFPQDWIRTLGELIVKVHIKDFDNAELIIAEIFYHVDKTPSLKAFKNLGDGNINWREVRRALSDIGYSGFINAELRGGDPDYLRDVCIRMDKIISGDEL
jgi:L-ribulose-5-phosphate 3-epimerase